MGGVAGHMAHLSEDTELTFNEIVDILGKVANAEITNATEKVDGQNLFLSWTITPDGEVEVARAGDARTARNAGDIKKGGMTTDEYISKWKGHPAESAFTNGFKAISTALRGLSPDDLEAIFSNGQRYVNMEIMYPGNPNIILYSAPNVVLHGLQDFGEEEVTPEMRQLTKQKFAKLVSLVDGAVEKVGDENWNIHGPKLVALKKLADGSALEDVTSKIQSFAGPVGMDATVGAYVELVVRKYAEQVDLPSDITEKLITLMLQPDEAKEQGITVVKLKKGLPKELQSTVSTLGSKTKSRKYIASVLKPLEVAISDFAIEVLRGVKSYFVSDNNEEVARMRTELEQSIAYLKNLQASGDEKMGELVDQQLAKLGDIENLASSMEGVVFEYPPGSDKIYKLTGAFAMANQIIGRARRSGMTEDASEDFTIRISKDREMTKTIDEWLAEIKAAKHEYTKLPQSVYEDVLSGMPLVDIVEEENAIPTVYNAVMGYVNGLLAEDEEDFIGHKYKSVKEDDSPWGKWEDEEYPKAPWDEDERADPVVDADYTGETIAFVPGAFKPPHLGHLKMVQQYANRHDVDRVIILISSPKKKNRMLDDGTIIKATQAEDVWKLLLVSAGLADNPKVDLRISKEPSPIGATLQYIGKEGPLQPGDKVILGASDKPDDSKDEVPDWHRWLFVDDKDVKEGVEVMDLESNAVKAFNRQGGTAFRATDMRSLISKAKTDINAIDELEEFVGADNVFKLLAIFGMGPGSNDVSEAVGQSAIQGAPAAKPNWTDLDVDDENAEQKRQSRLRTINKENIDLSMLDEVMKLIIGKGIVQ